MAKLVIRTINGNVIEAPMEAWIVALINNSPPNIQQDVFADVGDPTKVSLEVVFHQYSKFHAN